jgi:hypothetical protein
LVHTIEACNGYFPSTLNGFGTDRAFGFVPQVRVNQGRHLALPGIHDLLHAVVTYAKVSSSEI